MRRFVAAVFVWMVAGVVFGAVAQEEAKAVPGPVLLAGFARTDITPAVGGEIPGGFEKNFSKGVHDPLYAEAAVLVRDATPVAIVGLDTIMIPGDVVAAAREQAEAKTGIPRGNILIAASHTHNGGPIVDCFSVESDPAYCALVGQRIVEAIAQAREKAVAARVGAGVGHEDTVAFNRRFKMKDGTVRTHPGKMNPDIVEPAGPIDPDVGVLSVTDAQGALLGCIVNYTMHGTVLGSSELSADWPCYVRKTIRGALGREDMGVVFLNGACGDVTQVDNRNPRPAEFGEAWAKRIGTIVGAEALKVLARTEYTADAPLAVATEVLDLPIRDLAATDEELVARETPATGLGSSATQNAIYLQEARKMREIKAKSPTVPVEVQALRVGPVGIVSNSCEYFCAFGLSIKHASPMTPTFVVELANGYNGYCPTPEAFQGGGYEIRTARSSYLAPESGQRIVDASVRLLKKL